MELELNVKLLNMGCGERTIPWTTRWRYLPGHLLEWPTHGSWNLEREGHDDLVISHQEMLLVPAGVWHCLNMISRGKMSSTWIIFSVVTRSGLPLTLDPRAPGKLSAKFSRLARPFIEKIRVLHNQGDGPGDALVREAGQQALGFQLLEALARECPHFGAPSPDLERLRPVFEFLREHLHERFSRSDLARRAHVSPTRFHYIFKEATGKAPAEFVQEARLRRAQELLITTGRAVGEVAAQCGFTSPYYFSRAFRRALGMTPTQFRRNVR